MYFKPYPFYDPKYEEWERAQREQREYRRAQAAISFARTTGRLPTLGNQITLTFCYEHIIWQAVITFANDIYHAEVTSR